MSEAMLVDGEVSFLFVFPLARCGLELGFWVLV